ncbi:MAG: MerR family DNA-binding transcriptional regulator [Christensenellaceae bacterium]|jgi:DNA-binding transcriptional MerR regulator|nr:MerR family DNA-binding transcriptional regulator [Christensenellaceae bacterium]
MNELLSIREFSKLSGIESTTLRYWDDIGLFSPVRRDPENNYRYYAPSQIIGVNFITVLSSLSIPLKTINGVEEERTPAGIMDLIENQENALDMEMKRLRETYSVIHTRRDLIKIGLSVKEGDIFLKKVEDRPLLFGPPNVFEAGESFYGPFMRFCRQAKDLRINLNYPIGGWHADIESFSKAPGEPECFFSVDPTGNKKREAGEYLVGYFRGYYGELDGVPEKMSAYAREQGLNFAGPVYTIYLLDEVCVKDPSQYLVQICVAVSKKRKKR